MEVSSLIPQSVGIILFPDVELLDFAGPLQVFTSCRHIFPDTLSIIDLIAHEPIIGIAKTGTTIKAHLTFEDVVQGYDILLIPGGIGTRTLIKNAEMMSEIKRITENSKIITSVCTGALVLAKMGLLKNKKATTHFDALDDLAAIDSTIDIDRSERYYDHGNIIVSEGVSAGIDMSFYLLSKYFGEDISNEVKKYIEY